MIKIHYECDLTNQKMDIEINVDTKTNKAGIAIVFDPEAKKDVCDPFGIMLGIINAVTENMNDEPEEEVKE